MSDMNTKPSSTTERFRVLIVDDLPDNIQVLAGILGTNYEVFFATDGITALEVARMQRPDLILLDVVMPGMDGFEVIAQLQADTATQEIPVIFVTAHQGSEAESAALEAGAVDFIPKPVNPSVARARVRVHAKLARRNRELEELSARYKKMADNFRELSIHDELTGLYNRHYLEQLLHKEVALAKREDQALAIAMLDLDHFKEINDQYGHAAGDAVLSETGKLIQDRLRESDTAFRYGGEEFMLVLPATSAFEALQLCEDLRQLLSERAVGTLEVGQVHMSVGISQLRKEEHSEQDAIQRADQALYQAKKEGRNRVVVDPGMD